MNLPDELKFTAADFDAKLTTDNKLEEFIVEICNGLLMRMKPMLVRVANEALARRLKLLPKMHLTVGKHGVREWTDSGLTGTMEPTHMARLIISKVEK